MNIYLQLYIYFCFFCSGLFSIKEIEQGSNIARIMFVIVLGFIIGPLLIIYYFIVDNVKLLIKYIELDTVIELIFNYGISKLTDEQLIEFYVNCRNYEHNFPRWKIFLYHQTLKRNGITIKPDKLKYTVGIDYKSRTFFLRYPINYTDFLPEDLGYINIDKPETNKQIIKDIADHLNNYYKK